MPDIRSAIDAANRGFVDAINRGDLDAAMEVYTDDAHILPPGAPMVRGRPAIRDFWAGAAEQMGITGVGLETVELREAGDGQAQEIGRWVMHGADGELGRGKYVVNWKDDGGRWRWDWDIWNTDA